MKSLKEKRKIAKNRKGPLQGKLLVAPYNLNLPCKYTMPKHIKLRVFKSREDSNWIQIVVMH